MVWSWMEVLTFLYIVSGVISMVGYITTIGDLLKGLPSANIPTYCTWAMVSAIGAIYGIMKLQDWAVFAIYAFAFLFCIVIIILRFRIPGVKEL